jgi:hypothetical protein
MFGRFWEGNAWRLFHAAIFVLTGLAVENAHVMSRLHEVIPTGFVSE